MTNELETIMAMEDHRTRYEALMSFALRLTNGAAPKLAAEEVLAICNRLEIESPLKSAPEHLLHAYWTLLRASDMNESVRHLCHAIVSNKANRERRSALLTLLKFWPEEFQSVVAKHVGPDEGDLIRIAAQHKIAIGYVSEGVGLLIDAARTSGTHHGFDAIRLEISELGGQEHLDRLLQLERTHGANWRWSIIIGDLRCRLSNRSPQQ